MRTNQLSEEYTLALVKSLNKKVERIKYSKIIYLRKKIKKAKFKSDLYWNRYNCSGLLHNWWMHCQWLEEHNNLLRKLQIAEGEFKDH